MHDKKMDSQEQRSSLEEMLEQSGILGRVPLSLLFPPDTCKRLNLYFGYNDEEEDEEKKERETERLRAIFVIWLLAAEHWELEGILDVPYERMQELAERFADAVEAISLVPEPAEPASDAPEEEMRDDALEAWIDLLSANALDALLEQMERGHAAYSEKVADVLDQGGWLEVLRGVDPVHPADRQEEQRAIEEVQLGVVGLLTATYSSRLIRSADPPCDADCARSSFDDNAAKIAGSAELRQLYASVSGRDPWEKAMALRELAASDGGQRLVERYARLREANRKQTPAAAEPEAAAKPTKETGLSK